MRSCYWSGLIPALLLGLLWTSLASSEGASDLSAQSREVTFLTKDLVELYGRFYPGLRGRESCCVLLLHGFGGNMQQNGWDTLAKELQREDFAVLAFDFRGHGQSVSVESPGSPTTLPKQGFWDVPANRKWAVPHKVNLAQPPRSIDFHDFDREYLPMLVNDIMAAKLFLDERNDRGECNSSRLIIIGAQEGASLGLLWMTSEFYRFESTQMLPVAPLRLGTESEGESLAGAVWLSISPTIGNRPLPVSEWLELVGNKQLVPMTFLYGERDQHGANFANSCVKLLHPNKANRKLSTEQAVLGTDLKGQGLLNRQLDTNSMIVRQLKKVREDGKANAWRLKKTDETAYMWNFPRGGLIPAKAPEERSMNLLPYNRLLP